MDGRQRTCTGVAWKTSAARVLVVALWAGATVVVSAPPAAAGTAMVAVADVAGCTADHEPTGSRGPAKVVADLPGPLLIAGDVVQGPSTKLVDFRNCYAPAWGQFNNRVRPVPGNHEYLTSGASGYFDYFGSRAGTRGKGYYSFSAGGWQVLALNSNCSRIGGCGPSSAMYRWLDSQLQSSSARCQLAYMHHPRWSQSKHGPTAEMAPLYALLYQHGVELLLTGHDHAYQRFAALDPQGRPHAKGIVQFVLAPGGSRTYDWKSQPGPKPVVKNNKVFGVLALDLRADGWSTRFLPEPGASFKDNASGSCHETGVL
jgi:hypothetical protein